MSARAKLRLGTRGSELARTQSGTIAAALERLGFAVELTIIKTSGDQNTTSAFASIGPQGVFVREIEQALVERRVELAVHSFKDLPTKSPPELTIAAVPQRVDPADLLLVRRDAFAGAADDWLPLKAGARVGTASARRRVWLKHFRPDLAVEPLRGNVPTRVRRLEEGSFDAIVLAAAGVERLQAEQRLGSSLAGVAVLRLDPRGSCRRRRKARSPCNAAATTRACSQRSRSSTMRRAARPSRPSATRSRAPRAAATSRSARTASPPTATHELVAMLERAGAVRVARVRGADPATLGAAAWAKLDAALLDDAARRQHAGPPRLAHAQRGRLRRVGRAARAPRRGPVALAVHSLRADRRRRRCERRARGGRAEQRLARVHVAARRRGVRRARAARRCRAQCRVAVVGAATAEAARAELGRVDLVGGGTAAALGGHARRLGELMRHPRVLLAVAENAGDALERTLAAAGARCTRLDVYRTVPAPAGRAAAPVVGAARG